MDTLVATRQNPILERVLASDYLGGLQAYETTKTPSAEDDRWAGYCLFVLGRLLEAKDVLTRAIGKGCAAAAIELTTVHRQLGNLQDALHVLETLDTEGLQPFDQALREREKGVLLLWSGRLVEATEALEKAWALALKNNQLQFLCSSITNALARAYDERGLFVQALHYFNLSVEHAHPEKRVYPLMNLGFALIGIGQYTNAERTLFEAKSIITQSPQAEPVLKYYLGVLRRAQGRWSDALELFADAAAQAKTVLDAETEFFAELGLASLHVALEQPDQARAHLSRARGLATDDRKQAYLTLREGAMRGLIRDARAFSTLEQSFQLFDRMGMQREAAWAQLHLAETYLRGGDAMAADTHLEQATDIRHAIGSGSTIVPELRGLPLSFDRITSRPAGAYVGALLADWRDLEGNGPASVRVVTLGTPQLLADDRPLKLVMRRGLEVLAYLLFHPDVTRDQLLAALWPDDSPDAGANYLHQVRHEFSRLVPGLSIVFDKTSKRYRVRCEGPRLRFDALDIKRALSAVNEDDLERAVRMYAGPFLPQAESEWARSEREALEWSVIKTGLRLMDSWSARGDYAKCLELSQRLLEIEPWNEVLVEYLVSAVGELEGAVAATRTMSVIARRFETEVGGLPPKLQELQQRVAAVN
jgi:DNA-binding SARP family transcriptional activator/tetratricopeptide (TPR) repeat protein